MFEILPMLLRHPSLCMQFYGTINSLYKALAEPLTAFVFPAAVYTWVYRSQSARSGAVLKPWKCAATLLWPDYDQSPQDSDWIVQCILDPGSRPQL